MQSEDEKFMKAALKEAKKAYAEDEVPVGAVLVKNGKIIAKAHNQKEAKNDTTKHAEIMAIQKASKKLNNWRLEGTTLYVTLEPCTMCIGAIIGARIKRLCYGATDDKTGACGSVLNIPKDYKFNHVVEVMPKIMEKECIGIMQDFFKMLRERKQTKKRGEDKKDG